MSEQNNTKFPPYQAPAWPFITDIDREMLLETIKEGNWSGGSKKAAFESRFAADCGVKHCKLVANGTVSLELILRGFGIGYGDEVILPPYTFIATLSSIVFTGATPVFADIDPGTLNLSHKTVEEKITKKTKAIVAVAVGGCPPKLDELTEIAKRHNLKLIVDAAQAVGAVWNGKNICSYGDAASVSCQNTKNLTSGEGGIITTNDGALAQALTVMLNGGEKDGQYISVGQDHNISEFQASVLLSQYEKLDAEMYLREKNAAYLSGRLKALEFISPCEYDPRITRHAYHLYVVRFDSEKLAKRGLDRKSFLQALISKGVDIADGYRPLYTFPCVSTDYTKRVVGGSIDTTPLPETELAAFKEAAWFYQSVLLSSREHMDYIVDTMQEIWDNAKQQPAKS